MPHGKPAGVRCVQLDDQNRCQLFELPERPVVCRAFQPSQESCGDNFAEAMNILGQLERLTGQV